MKVLTFIPIDLTLGELKLITKPFFSKNTIILTDNLILGLFHNNGYIN